MNKKNQLVLDSLEDSTDAKKWFQGQGEHFIRKLGIREGHSVLDFGCRIGHFVIPIARVVGSTGQIFALDKNHSSIDILMKNAQKIGLNNHIIPIKTMGELIIPLEDDSIDAVLLYDIIHIIIAIDGTLKPLQLLIKEISRVLKPGGLLSISVSHLREIKYTKQEIIREIEKKLTFKNTLKEEIMHWNWLREEEVDNFTFRV